MEDLERLRNWRLQVAVGGGAEKKKLSGFLIRSTYTQAFSLFPFRKATTSSHYHKDQRFHSGKVELGRPWTQRHQATGKWGCGILPKTEGLSKNPHTHQKDTPPPPASFPDQAPQMLAANLFLLKQDLGGLHFVDNTFPEHSQEKRPTDTRRHLGIPNKMIRFLLITRQCGPAGDKPCHCRKSSASQPHF